LVVLLVLPVTAKIIMAPRPSKPFLAQLNPHHHLKYLEMIALIYLKHKRRGRLTQVKVPMDSL
jgi:hypothetical protein